jgi:hypothetical protein
MAVTLTLSTTPATAAREKYGTTMSLDLLAPSLGSETLTAVSNVAEIKTAVARFGAKMRTAYPEASFYVSVSLANRNAWSGLALARALLRAVVATFVPSGPIVIGVDHTLERRRDRRIGHRLHAVALPGHTRTEVRNLLACCPER